MSENILTIDPNLSLAEQWAEPEASLGEHLWYMAQGIRELESKLILPAGDRRYQTVYALLTSGRGQDSAVLAEGDPGTVKTVLGDMLLGGENRTEINSSHTEATLYGHESPVYGKEKLVGGKIKGLNPKDVRVWLNEVGHKGDDTQDFLRLYDTPSIDVHGETIDLTNGAFYSASNFANQRRVRKLEAAFRSRQGATILTGDVTDSMADRLHTPRDQQAVRQSPLSPLVPDQETRRSIHDQAVELHPVTDGESIGRFVTRLIRKLNESGIVKPLSVADGRTSEGMVEVARAAKLVDDIEELSKLKGKVTAGEQEAALQKQKSDVSVLDVARVAALCLPNLVELSGEAVTEISKSANGGFGRISMTEQGIFVRRHIARTALSLYFSEFLPTPKLAPDKILERYDVVGLQELQDDLAGESTYASTEAPVFDVDSELDKVIVTIAKKRESQQPKDAAEQNGKVHGLRKLVSRVISRQ